MKIRPFQLLVSKPILLGIIGAFLAIPLGSLAQTPRPNIDPKADIIFRQMTDYLKSAQSFSFQAEITYDEVRSTGEKLQFGAVADYVVHRPNLLQANYIGDRRQVSFFYDGTNFSMWEKDKNLYGTFKAASDIDGLVDQIQDNYGFSLPMGDLLSTTIYPLVMQKALSSRYLGLAKIRGVSCHHLAFKGESRDFQIWVSENQPPVPCKFIITYKDEPESPQYTAIFSNWDFNSGSPDDPRFQFSIPPNAQKIEFLPRLTTQEESDTPSGENP